MSQPSPFQRRHRVVNGLALALAVMGIGSLGIGFAVNEGGQPSGVVTVAEILLIGCIPLSALVVVAGLISLAMIALAWVKDRQRARVTDVVLFVVALVGCILPLLWGAFAFGFGGPSLLSDLCVAGAGIAVLLIVIGILLSLSLAVIANRVPS